MTQESTSRFTFIGAGIIICLMFASIAFSQEGYPLREKYPDIQIISTEKLKQRYQEVTIIDVRSKMEFDVVRIKKAIHMPIGTVEFERQLETYKHKKRTLVFYCNGHTCEKSYKATRKAHKLGLQAVLCYDSGISDWGQAYPNLSTLMGRPVSEFNQMIPKSQYQLRLASLEEFRAKAASPDTIVIDVRDHAQRLSSPGPDIAGIKTATLDDLLRLITMRKFRDSLPYTFISHFNIDS